ncbi:superoxide dismutase [candidate division KSB1 bacterium]|nr:MAG: superoxide dismutase [candidate division KSB1 bacterium]RPH97084.1 MAG: superoxide dismutase [candidate division KSB1 bacterium]
MLFTPKDFGTGIFELDGISKKTVEEHLKLYNGYVNKSNEVMEKLPKVDLSTANQVFSDARALKVELSFAVGGMQNHEIYFSHLKKNGGEPQGELRKQIEKDFGSVEQYLKDLKASGLSARGWAWTVWFPAVGKLVNWVGDSQNTYLSWDLKPLLALDVYEHAYLLDHGVNRGAYIDAFLKNLDWDRIGDSYSKARK